MGKIIVMSLMPLMYFPTPVCVSKLTAEIESDDNYRYPPPLGGNPIHDLPSTKASGGFAEVVRIETQRAKVDAAKKEVELFK